MEGQPRVGWLFLLSDQLEHEISLERRATHLHDPRKLPSRMIGLCYRGARAVPVLYLCCTLIWEAASYHAEGNASF